MLRTRGVSTGAGFGYASGDADPADDQLNDFTFDRNHGVGMVLFDEVQGAIEAATHQNLINPEHVGVRLTLWKQPLLKAHSGARPTSSLGSRLTQRNGFIFEPHG